MWSRDWPNDVSEVAPSDYTQLQQLTMAIGNEQWLVAPKSDIVSRDSSLTISNADDD